MQIEFISSKKLVANVGIGEVFYCGRPEKDQQTGPFLCIEAPATQGGRQYVHLKENQIHILNSEDYVEMVKAKLILEE